jgi:phage host-nuclease inhibitor protein Gam
VAADPYWPDERQYVLASIALANQAKKEAAMSKPNRIKTEAATVVAQNREEVDAFIQQIGEAQRRRDELQTAMNDELARVKEHFEAQAAPHAAVIRELGEGVRVWCEAHRVELTRDGKVKTAKLAAGEISWRTRPPKVTVRGEEIVIAALKRLGLGRFVRTKDEVNKTAILQEPADVRGISISKGEDFVIKPFATELEEVTP